jgi:hypothetical protein
MTRITRIRIECVCGEATDLEYYDSVNIDADPELKQKVVDRQINFFKCDKCGFQQELAVRFLYHDMTKKIMVWVLPEHEKNQEGPNIAAPEGMHSMAKELGIREFVVFGFDGLFELLEKDDIA